MKPQWAKSSHGSSIVGYRATLLCEEYEKYREDKDCVKEKYFLNIDINLVTCTEFTIEFDFRFKVEPNQRTV